MWAAASRQTHSGTHTADGAHAAVRAFCITHDAPLDWARFGLWMSMLLNRHGSDILRVQGFDVAGVAAPVVIHGVQHTIHTPEHLAAWPDGDTRTRIVETSVAQDFASPKDVFVG
jgi:G3E family GTPase